MENKELYNIFPELGHEVFEEKIEKPLELYLHANSNVVSMNSLITVIANAIEKSKLWEAGFDGGNESSKQVSIIIFGRL
jgi:hypothetical protein